MKNSKYSRILFDIKNRQMLLLTENSGKNKETYRHKKKDGI